MPLVLAPGWLLVAGLHTLISNPNPHVSFLRGRSRVSSFVSSLKSSSQQSYANADKFRRQTHRLQTALMLATEIFNGTHQVENLVDADGGKKIPLSKNSWQLPNRMEAGRTTPNGTIQTHHLTFQHFLLKNINYNQIQTCA
jgi:hypothetical protein